MNRYYIKEKKCTSFSSSIDKRYYFYCGQSDSSLYFGLLGQAWGSIQSDVKDQELVPPATCQNQQKKITAIPFYFNTGFFYLKSAILKYRAQGSFKLFFEIFTSGFVGLKRRFFTKENALREKQRLFNEVSYQLLTNWSRNVSVCFLVAE